MEMPMSCHTAPAADPAAALTPEVARVLVDNHARFRAFLERRVGRRDVAEEILQDAFVKGLDHAGAVRDAESVTAWFYRLLRNALVDHLRRRGAEQRALEQAAREPAEDEPAPDEAMMGEVCRCVTALVETLKPEYATALRRVDLEGTSVKAFAEEAGISANNAAVRLFRAREALRKQLERSCGTCTEHGCMTCTCGVEGGGCR
jgi:RNA polymerase sigma-70 factor (ECF subfamily)